MKMLKMIIDKGIRTVIENTLDESKCGFRRIMSIRDHIFTIKQIKQVVFQEQRKIFLAFIDLGKAFRRMPRRIL